ncbi:DUF6318 family protein [Actinomyces timonensis]|uniref:DUF6318 family protein n=1 Tax=Actinomyces timonensis TaxID=1288391 RepID=A0AAU8N5M4_9ACTO
MALSSSSLLVRAPRPPLPRRRGARLDAGSRRPIVLALAFCCALGPVLLAACAKDPAPPEVSGTLPTQFAAATPSVSAPASLSPELAAQRATALAMPKPAKPDIASQNTEDGAVRAAFYFLELYRYAFVTGDTTDLAAMSEEGCVFCRSTIDDATALHAGGGWANPWDREAPSVVYIPSGEGKEYCGVRMTIKSGESTSVNAKGEIQYSEARDETRLLFALRHHGDGWRVGQVSLLK